MLPETAGVIIGFVLTIVLTAGAWARGWKGWSLIPFAVEMMVAFAIFVGISAEMGNSITGMVSSETMGMYVGLAVIVGLLKFLVLIIMCASPRR